MNTNLGEKLKKISKTWSKNYPDEKPSVLFAIFEDKTYYTVNDYEDKTIIFFIDPKGKNQLYGVAEGKCVTRVTKLGTSKIEYYEIIDPESFVPIDKPVDEITQFIKNKIITI